MSDINWDVKSRRDPELGTVTDINGATFVNLTGEKLFLVTPGTAKRALRPNLTKVSAHKEYGAVTDTYGVQIRQEYYVLDETDGFLPAVPRKNVYFIVPSVVFQTIHARGRKDLVTPAADVSFCNRDKNEFNYFIANPN